MPLFLALGRQRQADPCEFRVLHSLFGLYKEFQDGPELHSETLSWREKKNEAVRLSGTGMWVLGIEPLPSSAKMSVFNC